MIARYASLTVLASVLAFGPAACGGGEAEPKAPEMPADPPPPAAPEPAPAAAEPTGAATQAATPAPPPEPAPPPLTDEQVAAVFTASNAAEVEHAKLAQKNAKDAKVKKFAGMMVKDHGDANKKHDAWLKKNKMTAADSDVSKQITSDSTQLADTLKGLKGPDFDKAYMDAQVKEHQKVLDTIDKRLLPAAKNPDLKTAITDMRAKVEAHLKEAQDIQTALASAPPPGEKPAKGGGATPATPANPGKPGGGATPATPATPPKKQ